MMLHDLDDPDEVGSPEYRVIVQEIAPSIGSGRDDVPEHDHIVAVLGDFQRHLDDLRSKAELTRPTPR